MMTLFGAKMEFKEFKEIISSNLESLEGLLTNQSNPETAIQEHDLYYDPNMSFTDWFEFFMQLVLSESESIDDSNDGDHQSALASAGWGTDEDYGGAAEIL